jgi:hypothetical protein
VCVYLAFSQLTVSLSLSITASRALAISFSYHLCVCVHVLCLTMPIFILWCGEVVRVSVVLAVHTWLHVLSFFDSRYLLQSLSHAHSLPSHPRPRSFPLFRPLSQSVQLTVDASKKELSLWTTDEVHELPPPSPPLSPHLLPFSHPLTRSHIHPHAHQDGKAVHCLNTKQCQAISTPWIPCVAVFQKVCVRTCMIQRSTIELQSRSPNQCEAILPFGSHASPSLQSGLMNMCLYMHVSTRACWICPSRMCVFVCVECVRDRHVCTYVCMHVCILLYSDQRNNVIGFTGVLIHVASGGMTGRH